jgi:hypothetical protein
MSTKVHLKIKPKMLNQKAPILILHGSRQPYLSIGRHYGGITAFGHEYIYIHIHDAFLRKDFVKKYNKHKKERGSWESFIDLIKATE